MTKFYSYVNMIYPQVKAVFYFDVSLSGGQHSYALNGSSAVASAYRSGIANNGAYLAQGKTSATGWEELSQTKLTKGGTVKLAAYVSFPGVKNATVQYYVDGALVGTSSQAPYYCQLDTAALGGGAHKVQVVAKGGGKFAPDDKITRQEICVMFNKAIQYVDQVNGTQTLTNLSTTVDSGKFNDVDQIASWAVESMALMTNNGVMAGKGSGVAPLANTTVEEAIALVRAVYNKF